MRQRCIIGHVTTFLIFTFIYVIRKVVVCCLPLLICSLGLANTEQSSELFSREQSDNGVGTDSEVVCWETGPKSSDSFSFDRFCEAVWYSAVGKFSVWARLLFLNLRLDVVEWEGSHGSCDSCEHRGAHLDLEWTGGFAHRGGRNFLGRVVGHKHGDIQSCGSEHGWNGSLPERSDALVLDDSCESVSNVLVVSALFDGQGAVGLHTHKCQVAWVSDKGAEGTSGHCACSFLEGREVAAIIRLFAVLAQVEVDTETGGTVNRLSQKG